MNNFTKQLGEMPVALLVAESYALWKSQKNGSFAYAGCGQNRSSSGQIGKREGRKRYNAFHRKYKKQNRDKINAAPRAARKVSR
jgi:hypothetical protein